MSFFTKKQLKLIKKEENSPNSNRLIKFSEIWYVDAFQLKKIQQQKYFLISAFLGLFVGQKTAKTDKKLRKSSNLHKSRLYIENTKNA